MSDESRKPSAIDIQRQAADWVFERRDCENWTAEDQAKLESWLGESTAHRVAYVRLETMLVRSNRLVALRNSSAATVRRAERPNRRSFFIAAAAGLVVVALAGAGSAMFIGTPQTQTYSTALGDHKIVTLADGSRIELNTNTVLRARISARERSVWLDKGEAYFQVAHEKTRPFVVIAGDYRVVDLGTAFSVRNDANHLKVALVEGLARFEAARANIRMQPSNLTPGDVVVATAQKVTVTKRPEIKLINDLAWRQGLLVFNYTTLADAAAEFNRYNAKKLVVADESSARLTVMGKFPATNVDLFGQVAKAALGVHIENRGNEIVISKRTTGK